jgi:hypothetical protein
MAVALVCLSGGVLPAYESLGTGTISLLGGDLTDPEDDGEPDRDVGYNAVFTSNEEPGFGGGEFAFNVFDNRLGPSNDKWCCGPGGGIPEEGLWVTAQLDAGPHILTHFTVSSANDVPNRDPTVWAVQGSNDGEVFTDIFEYDDVSPWVDRLEVIQFTAGADFPQQTVGYEYFRFVTYDTEANPSGAYYQVGEIEYFGQPGSGGGLQAGDANMDWQFDQLDLVQVQIAGKYLTGQPATWGEGDWDGAPGGEPGNPPEGDGVFSQLDIIAALTAEIYLTGPYNAVTPSGSPGEGQTFVAVPEPSTCMLVGLALVAALGVRLRRAGA